MNMLRIINQRFMLWYIPCDCCALEQQQHMCPLPLQCLDMHYTSASTTEYADQISSLDGENCRFKLSNHCFIWLDTQALWPMWPESKYNAQMCRTSMQAQLGDTCCVWGWWLRDSAHKTSSADDAIHCATQLHVTDVHWDLSSICAQLLQRADLHKTNASTIEYAHQRSSVEISCKCQRTKHKKRRQSLHCMSVVRHWEFVFFAMFRLWCLAIFHRGFVSQHDLERRITCISFVHVSTICLIKGWQGLVCHATYPLSPVGMNAVYMRHIMHMLALHVKHTS